MYSFFKLSPKHILFIIVGLAGLAIVTVATHSSLPQKPLTEVSDGASTTTREQAFVKNESTTSPSVYQQRLFTAVEIEAGLKKLSSEAYVVLAQEGTEPPFHNEYWNNEESGIYVDVVTGRPLFSSLQKYDSGTGWPSFYAPLKEANLTLKTDSFLGYERTEVRSEAGHLGHVFDDGPPEHGGKRYCMNSLALRFIPKDQMAGEGYAAYLDLF